MTGLHHLAPSFCNKVYYAHIYERPQPIPKTIYLRKQTARQPTTRSRQLLSRQTQYKSRCTKTKRAIVQKSAGNYTNLNTGIYAVLPIHTWVLEFIHTWILEFMHDGQGAMYKIVQVHNFLLTKETVHATQFIYTALTALMVSVAIALGRRWFRLVSLKLKWPSLNTALEH